MDLDLDAVTAWCTSKGWKRPVTADPGERRRLLQILQNSAARVELAEFMNLGDGPLKSRLAIQRARQRAARPDTSTKPIFLPAREAPA
jgi:hypothetical protein